MGAVIGASAVKRLLVVVGFAFMIFGVGQSHADPIYISQDMYDGPAPWSTVAETCAYLETKVRDGYTSYPCEITGIDYRRVTIDGTHYDNRRYIKMEIPVAGLGNPTIFAYEFEGVNPLPPSAPPVCEAPEYQHPASGDCVLPTEVSYDNFDTQTVETVHIEETSSEPTQNCATDSAGNDVCLTSDPSTFTINGQSASPEAGVSCGWKNGAYDCISDDSCTDFNGEQVCTSPYGNIITSGDPQGLMLIKKLPWGDL